MSGKKATVARLADLHNLVTEALIDGVTTQEIEVEGPDGKPRKEKVRPSAAVIAVALTHLKNNSITADPETNERLHSLRDRLQKRRDAGKAGLSQVEMDEASTSYQGTMQ